MSIEQNKTEDGRISYRYVAPDEKTIYTHANQIATTLESYIQLQKDLKFSDVRLDDVLLGQIVVRVDKRKDYFMIYHDDTKINEIKEAALLAYWFLKFKPIKIITVAKQEKYRYINEGFAIFLLYSVCYEEYDRLGMKFCVTDEYSKKLLYAFKYWNLNKGALMMIAESLCSSISPGGNDTDD